MISGPPSVSCTNTLCPYPRPCRSDAPPRQHADQWAGTLEAQLTSQVRWRETVERMVADGATTFVELGPGSVLTGMAKRSAPGATVLSASTPDSLGAVVDAAREAGVDRKSTRLNSSP